MARIDCYSHYIKITELDNRTRQVVERYQRSFCTKMGTRQVGWANGRPIFEKFPAQVFGLNMKDGKEFRLHINQLDDFLSFTIADKLSHEFKVHHVPLYSPVACDFKVNNHWSLRGEQELLVDYITGDEVNHSPARQRAAILQAGQGKAQPLYAKIKVPGGWKFMGDMQIGDTVTARDGSPTTVTAVHPQGIKPIYRITFADGRSTECCKEHLWKIYRPNMAWESKVVDTEEIIRVMNLSQTRASNKGHERIHIDLPVSEQSPDIELPIDPWVLGVIIGDGGISQGAIGISTADQFVVDKLKSKLPKGLSLNKTIHGKYDYILAKDPSLRSNEYTGALRDLGLMGKLSYFKFIPTDYLHGSHNQRLSLLQGLMDTDGTVGEDGSSINYSTSSEELANNVQYLARSLGYIAKVSSRIPKFTYKGEKKEGARAYRVWIRAKVPSELFTLPRQLERLPDTNQYSNNLKLRILKVEISGYEECQCISVDHPEHLYVTDDFIVTHNTLSALISVARSGVRSMLTLKGGYAKQWVNVITGAGGKPPVFDNLKKGDILLINGTKNLVSLMYMALDGSLNAKFIIVTNKTWQMYINDYLTNRHNLDIYPIPIDVFFEKLGIGLLINDEVHMHFHFNYMQDMFSHVPKTLGLTATLTPDDPFMDRQYKTMFPLSTRFKGVPFKKYAHGVAIHYKLAAPRFARYKQKGMGSYSHIVYEEWLLANKPELGRYLSIIDLVVEHEYVNSHDPGEKVLLFAASIQFCTLLHKRYKEKYPNLEVLRYVEDDPFENLENSDVCISTLLSSGTAVDIKGLIRVIMTTALGSSQLNEQAFGRLREIPTRHGLKFVWFCCDSIPQHVAYDTKKQLLLKDKALSIENFDINIKV